MDYQIMKEATLGMVAAIALNSCVLSKIVKLGYTVATVVSCGEKVAKGIRKFADTRRNDKGRE